ncbi:hypothetical protein AX17_002040 [Amanita inopinata Kibby_2008]|nr:hypothetical protein AX17_002040 [Amanita inopinata Kibby_2008]
MFTSQPRRRFILNLCMAGTLIRLTQYNRTRVVHGEYFDAQSKENRSTLLRIIIGLMFCAPEDIGYDPTIRIGTDTQGIPAFYMSVGQKEYRTVDSLFESESICGRGTVVWKATDAEAEDINDESKWVTIKDVWTDKSQPYDGAEDTTDRLSFSNKRPEATPTSSNEPKKRKKKMQEDETWKVRVHRRYVFKGCGIPITQFRNKDKLLRALIDLIRTHKRLVDADLLHRNISLSNVMLWKVPNEERRRGFLIDFDYMARISKLASLASHSSPVGTTPFMSTDVLIGDGVHSPDDDLESFFYILIFICLEYSGPGRARDWDIRETRLCRWIEGDNLRNTGYAKYSDDLGDCLEAIRVAIFIKPQLEKGAAVFTHQDFIKILEERLEKGFDETAEQDEEPKKEVATSESEQSETDDSRDEGTNSG